MPFEPWISLVLSAQTKNTLSDIIIVLMVSKGNMRESTPIINSDPKLIYFDGSISSNPMRFGTFSVIFS
jgi:hypothetical protein